MNVYFVPPAISIYNYILCTSTLKMSSKGRHCKFLKKFSHNSLCYLLDYSILKCFCDTIGDPGGNPWLKLLQCQSSPRPTSYFAILLFLFIIFLRGVHIPVNLTYVIIKHFCSPFDGGGVRVRPRRFSPGIPVLCAPFLLFPTLILHLLLSNGLLSVIC